MRYIVSVQLDKRRPALVLTREHTRPDLGWVTVAPITSSIRGTSTDVPVGPRNGLDHACVVSCDSVTTVRADAVEATLGLFFDDQEPSLAEAIGAAFDLFLGSAQR